MSDCSNQGKCCCFKKFFGPFLPILVPFLCGIFLLSLSRALLTYLFWPRLADTVGVLKLFLVGLRMDVIILCYLFALPLVFIFFAPKRIILKFKKLFSGYVVAVISFLFWMEISTYQFIKEYDLRPDRKFFEYLGHPKEVFDMLFKAYWGQIIIGLIVLCILAYFVYRMMMRLLANYSEWQFKTRLIIFPVFFFLFFWGARSSLGHRPANLSVAYFSENHLANELALNSGYTVGYAFYRAFFCEKNPSKYYGKFSEEEAVTHIQELLEEEGRNLVESDVPFMQKQVSPFQYEKSPNIVTILLESEGADSVGCLEGPDVTPNLCRIKDQGLWFSSLYSTGTRTARGIEAVVTGFLPTANNSIIKLSKARSDFFTIAALLKKFNYTTEFIYGGMSNFDEMRSFFMGNGFDKVYDETTHKDPIFKTSWGVSDEDLFNRANEIFKKQNDKPFYALILTTSNHVPYEYPDGRIEQYEEPKYTHYNALKYSDYALGMFFDKAQQEEYYKNTIFVVVADHAHQVYGNGLVPVNRFHIPAFIIGPNVPAKEISKISSQIDLMPTVLHFSGLTIEHPMIGRNMVTLADEIEGRAIMQFAENAAYRKGDNVVILRPYTEPAQFKVVGADLQAMPLDPALAKDALSYAFLPWHLYSNKLYRLD